LNVILLLVSGLTVFIAGLGANFEFDLKRIIALSTLRQLGLMIITISIGLSSLAFFHLQTHALLKTLLFMCSGGVILSIGDSQDIRCMGGLSIHIPFTSSNLIVSNFAFCGILFMAGFYSTDFILEMFSMRCVNMFGFLVASYPICRNFYSYPSVDSFVFTCYQNFIRANISRTGYPGGEEKKKQST
jgi:NADH-ubiquinone oxidoreductase chain 5